jgi:hypothetical protein
MKLLPAAGPERTRLFVLLALLAVAGVAAYYMNTDATPPATAGLTGPASNSSSGTAQSTAPQPQVTRASRGPRSDTPEPLRLPDLEAVPDEPVAARNPFRFGFRPPPTPPAPVFTPTPTPTPTPTGPPPIPPVPLKLSGIMRDPYGIRRAYLVDQTGVTFEGVEGQTIDGRYRLVTVGETSAVVEYVNGTGRRTLQIGR